MKEVIESTILQCVAECSVYPLQDHYKYLVALYYEMLETDEDYRTGVDTYGFENVFDTLDYISDRWYCAFRVRWLIELLNRDFILYSHD